MIYERSECTARPGQYLQLIVCGVIFDREAGTSRGELHPRDGGGGIDARDSGHDRAFGGTSGGLDGGFMRMVNTKTI